MNNKKGFTLVELLVVIVILGIITGISIPLIRNVMNANEKSQYATYKDSIKQSAKLYVNSYGEDLFGEKKSGCAILEYQDMVDKGLLKNIPVDNTTCANNKTYVRVVKSDEKYTYNVSIYCTSGGKAVFNESFARTSCDNPETVMQLTVTPTENKTNYVKRQNIKVIITSPTGIKTNASVRYAFATNAAGTNLEGGWHTLPLEIPGERKQKEMIEKGQIIEATATVTTPPNIEKRLYLTLKVDILEDISQTSWVPSADQKTTFGYYVVDEVAPTFGTSSVISTNTSYNALRPKLKVTANDTFASSEGKPLKMCVSFDTDTCTKDAKKIKNDIGYTTFDGNAPLNRIQNSYNINPHLHRVYVTIADSAGNTVTRYFNYEVAYTITYNKNNGTGTMEVSYCNKNVNCTIQNNAYTRAGYAFSKWNTNSNGNGTDYNSGNIIKLTSNVTLYAKWAACGAGTYSSGNQCVRCSKNTYSTGAANASCTNCPSGYTTSGTGSASLASCKISCGANTHVANVNGGCVSCPNDKISDAHTVSAGSTSNCKDKPAPPPSNDDDDDDSPSEPSCCDGCCCWCGTGCCGSGCFLAGEKVMTIFGLRDIDKIRAGDFVLTYNGTTGLQEYKRVLKPLIHINFTEDWYTLTMDDGSTLRVAQAHSFYVVRGNSFDWIKARNLKVGDMLMYIDGSYHTITDLSVNLETHTEYNLDVEENDTYYVGEKQILVHNDEDKGGGF